MNHLLSKERLQTFKEIRDSRYIYENKLDKACFQHNMVYVDFKYLPKRGASDKPLHEQAISLAKIQRMMDINTDFLQWSRLSSMVQNVLIKNLLLHV